MTRLFVSVRLLLCAAAAYAGYLATSYAADCVNGCWGEPDHFAMRDAVSGQCKVWVLPYCHRSDSDVLMRDDSGSCNQSGPADNPVYEHCPCTSACDPDPAIDHAGAFNPMQLGDCDSTENEVFRRSCETGA